MVGPDGVGKTTLAQQLALALGEVLIPTLLGFPVEPVRVLTRRATVQHRPIGRCGAWSQKTTVSSCASAW